MIRFARLPRVSARSMFVFVLVCAAASSGCGGEEGGAPVDDSVPEVRLLTHDSFVLPDGAAEEFRERTGARLEVIAAGDSGTMLAGALLSAGSPEADVIFGVDDASATKATDGDLLEPLDPSVLELAPQRYRLEGDGADLLAPIDTGDVCMNVDSAWFTDRSIPEPATLEQLTEKTYEDLTVVSSPVTSSPGLSFLVGTVDRYGEDGWADYWTRLRDNGVRVRPSWDDAYYNDYTVSGGDRPIVLSYASSPPAEVVFSEGSRTEPASAVMLDSCASQVEYAGVLRGTSQPELAAELVAFMLDDTWQSGLPLSNFVFPVTDVALPEEFVRWAPRPEDPMSLEPAVIAEGRDRWIESWRELME